VPEVENRISEMNLEVRAGPLTARVLARVLGLLSARAELGVDRVGDVLLVSDTLSATTGPLVGDHLTVAARCHPGRLELVIGPYVRGGATEIMQMLRIDGFAVLERLVDEIEIVTGGDSDFLNLAFVQQR
jgi:hypothetical protein